MLELQPNVWLPQEVILIVFAIAIALIVAGSYLFYLWLKRKP